MCSGAAVTQTFTLAQQDRLAEEQLASDTLADILKEKIDSLAAEQV